MEKLFSACAATLLGMALLACSGVSARAERRVALVVGNAHYNNASLILSNPKNDAEDVGAALKGIGFEVIQAIDANRRDLDLNMAKFARLATDADAALFFYAGHALQYQGRNYLMPIDAEVEDEVSLRYQMMLIDDVRAALDRASGVKIMILDACRNNPVVESLRRKASGESRSIGGNRGLARIDKTQGMVVAYSTASDEVAADGKGRNSPFTGAFLKRLREPGLEIEQLFRRVASDVNSETQGRQRPETYVSLLSDYYLNQTDRIAFEAVRDSPDVIALRNFVFKYPSSSYVSDVMSRIQSLDAANQQRQIQKARQEEAARQAEQQRRAEQEAAERKLNEQRRMEQEAADRKLSEQRRAEQEAAERKRNEAKAAAEAAEKTRLEREAASRIARQNADKDAAASTPSAAARPPKDGTLTTLAGVERIDVDQPAAGKAAIPMAPSPGLAPSPSPSPSPENAAASVQACDRDRARLTLLRGNPVRNEIVQFERELSCERLRPQLVRLRESILPSDALPGVPSVEAAKPGLVAKPGSPPLPIPPVPPAVVAAPVAVDTTVKTPLPDLTQPKAVTLPSSTASSDPQACQKDAARLARLRTSPSRAEFVAFERDLVCERLRPQIARLRESVLPSADAAADGTSPVTPQLAPPTRDADSNPPKVRMAPALPVPSCDQERAHLAQLRASQSRDDVVRFEQQLACEALRPQVMRLRESLSGG